MYLLAAHLTVAFKSQSIKANFLLNDGKPPTNMIKLLLSLQDLDLGLREGA